MFATVIVTTVMLLGMGHAQSLFQGAGCGLISNSGLQSTLSAQAPWYCPINQQISSTWAQWAGVAMIAVMIGFSVAALVFMVGIALRNEKIRNYGVGEIYEATATALIAIGFMYLCAVLFGLWPSILVGPINPYATAFHLMGETINTTQNFYRSLFNLYVGSQFLISLNVTPSINIPGAVASGFWTGLLAKVMNRVIPFINTLRPGIDFALTVFISLPVNSLLAQINGPLQLLYLEYYTLVFFSIASIPVFLIPGVILRSFIPTRAVGGMMMAIAMGFFLVMPTLFSVAYYVTAPQLLQSLNAMNSGVVQLNSQPISQLVLIGPSSPAVSTLKNAGNALSTFWLLVAFYPMVIAGITFAFIVQVGNFIGGSTQMGGKMRMFI